MQTVEDGEMIYTFAAEGSCRMTGDRTSANIWQKLELQRDFQVRLGAMEEIRQPPETPPRAEGGQGNTLVFPFF